MLTIGVLVSMVFAQVEPSSTQGWFDLGVKRHEARDFRGAAEAYEKARQLGYVPRPILNTRLARAFAQADEKDKAFAILQQMATNGFGPADMLNAEDELIPLRSDARWKTITDQMNRNAHPCQLSPGYRQFDYWLGEWDVEIGGRKFARSSIQLVLDECVIFENYTDAKGYAGKSFSIWDAARVGTRAS